jgi:hypothetical protein
MSIVTSQQLIQYYERYRETEVTFNTQVITATGLVPRNLYLRVLDRELPCTVFSSSMASARVIANVKANFFLDLKRPNTRLALRWCFKRQDKVEPMTFYVPCRVTGFTHFNVQKPGVQMMTLVFTQKPPNDLIEILGGLLEANWNSQQRRAERIPITPENMKKLGMESRDATLHIGDTSRPCLLRDLSFIGAKVLSSGLTQSDSGRPASLNIAKGEQATDMTLQGTITRVEEVGGRRDIKAVAIEYARDTPISYKLLINSFIASRKTSRDGDPGPAPARPVESRVEPPVEPPEEDSAPPLDTGQMEQFLPSPPHPKRVPDPDGESSPNG